MQLSFPWVQVLQESKNGIFFSLKSLHEEQLLLEKQQKKIPFNVWNAEVPPCGPSWIVPFKTVYHREVCEVWDMLTRSGQISESHCNYAAASSSITRQSLDKSNKITGCLYKVAGYVPYLYNNGINAKCLRIPHLMDVAGFWSLVHAHIALKSCSLSITGIWFIGSAVKDTPDLCWLYLTKDSNISCRCHHSYHLTALS